MIELHVVLTNEEARAIEGAIVRVEQGLAKRMQVAHHDPRDPSAVAWQAWRKLVQPIYTHLTHLTTMREKKRA